MKEETTELKGKADPNGTKWLSDDNDTIINHAEKLNMDQFIFWGKKLSVMNQVDPPVSTDTQKLAYFNVNYPIYDNQQTEIADIVEKKFDKTWIAFNNIDHRLRSAQKRQKQEDMLRSLRVKYLGKQNKRLIQDLESFMKSKKGSTAHNTEYMRTILTADYVCDAKTSTDAFLPTYLEQPWEIPVVNL